MRKSSKIILAAFILLANLCVFSFLMTYEVNRTLYLKPSVTIRYSSGDVNEPLETMLKRFSTENSINISQYVYIDEGRLNIYSTNISEDNRIDLKLGRYPTDKSFISNKDDNLSSHAQSGTFYFPLSDLNIHVYNFEQVRNVGLGDTFYVSTSDDEVLKNLAGALKPYGAVYMTKSSIGMPMLVDMTLLVITLTAFIAFAVMSYFEHLQNRNEFMIMDLWGYKKIDIALKKLRERMRYLLILFGIYFIASVLLVIALDQVTYSMSFILTFALTNALLVFFIGVIEFLIATFIQRSESNPSKLKGQVSMRKVQFLALGMKGLVVFALLMSLSTAITYKINLDKDLNRVDHWKKTENLYRMTVSSISGRDMNDLAVERELNERLSKFYNTIKAEKNAFLINSINFSKDDIYTDSPWYLYNINAPGEEEIYSPYGRSVIIDENYLKMNPIYRSGENNVLEHMVYDDKILNILVPEKYRGYEDKIYEAYQNHFYFMKVEVDNIYREDAGEPLNQTDKKSLHVNIIYVDNDQHYFTYNFYNGDAKNVAYDPIAIMYTDNIDTSFIAAYMTSSVYFMDYSDGMAYESISDLVQSSGVPEIRMVRSVYDQMDSHIFRLKEQLIRQSINFVVSLMGSVLIMTCFVWSYYQLNLFKVTIMYLNGYSSFDRNKKLVGLTTFVNILACGAVSMFESMQIVMILFAAVMVLDLTLISVMGIHFCRNNLSKIVKGDYI